MTPSPATDSSLNSNPNQAIVANSPTAQVVIASTVPVTHSSFSKYMAVLAALEPLVIAGISPFVKSDSAKNILATEHPLAQTLFEALSEL